MEKSLKPNHTQNRFSPCVFKDSHTKAINQIVRILKIENLSPYEINNLLREVKCRLNAEVEFQNEVVSADELNALLRIAC